MSRIRRSSNRPGSALLVGLILAAPTSFAGGVESVFLAEHDAAVAKMTAAMKLQPAGDVDADFVATMIPHHQGAIEVAQAELRYGRNERLRRIAQEIIATQREQIAAMHLALAPSAGPDAPSSARPAPAAVDGHGTVPATIVQPGL